MKFCRLCQRQLKDEQTVCSNCGYNIATDTVTPGFEPKPELAAKKENVEKPAKGGVSPGIKKFAFAGLALLIFSILYKYNFDINTLKFEATQLFARAKSGKLFKDKSDKKEGKEIQKIELINVRSFDGYKKMSESKDLKIEGISYDQKGKSFVIINGKVVPEGESFAGVMVKKISPDSVELIVSGETKILGVNQSIPFPRK